MGLRSQLYPPTPARYVIKQKTATADRAFLSVGGLFLSFIRQLFHGRFLQNKPHSCRYNFGGCHIRPYLSLIIC